MAKTTGDVIVEKLIDWGVDTVFGLPGDGINGIFEALRKNQDKIRFIQCRHEEAAAFAACGYAKFTGRLGVCFATSGPGAIHLLNGLYDAKLDHAPVLAITGQTYHDLIGMHFQQEIDILAAVQGRRRLQPDDPGAEARRARWSTRLPHGALGAGASSHLTLPGRHPGAGRSRTRTPSTQMVRGHTSVVVAAADRRPAGRDARDRRGAAQRRARRPSSWPGRGRWAPATSSSGSPTSLAGADRQAAAGQGGRPRRLAVHDRRHRPARHAALRGGDGGVRHACSSSARASPT